VAVLKKVRMAIVALLVVGLGVAGYAGYRLVTEEPPDHQAAASRVTGTTDDGWQVVTYRGLHLVVPPSWRRLDMDACDGDLPQERWGTAELDPCAPDAGLWFLASATFDPATGPGVHTAPVSESLPEGGWAGYVTRGDVVVDVADADEAVVRRILQSVSETI
jgi:hypothetical protein